MTTKHIEVDPFNVIDKSEQLSDLLHIIANAIAHIGGDTKELESCVSIAWSISTSINKSLFQIIAAQQFTRHHKKITKYTFRDHFRTQREACGLTTADLARLLDLDEEIIIQWESGDYEPTISMLIPLANILGCDPMWLLTGKPIVKE